MDIKILADSISHAGHRLTTLAVTYPRIIHAEMLRHRVWSRCAASSRAIPVQRFIEQVEQDPYVPSEWGSNKPGMQAGEPIADGKQIMARAEWLSARTAAVSYAQRLLALGVHKQTTNRLLEPFQWMTEVITATEWENFFALRIHPDAHPDIQTIAVMMRDALSCSVPEDLADYEWHLPLVSRQERCLALADFVSVGRVARVSYLRHEDESNRNDDVARAKKMLNAGHLSPFEHVARPANKYENTANFQGWMSLRKLLPNEANPLGAS